MKQLNTYIIEKILINQDTNVYYLELDELAYRMFNKYSFSYTYNEMTNWVKNGLEPDDSDYEEFIDDILEYCKEEHINHKIIQKLESYINLDNKEQEKIKNQIFKGMKKYYADRF